MKKLIILSLLALCSVKVQAQLPFATRDSIDVNNLSATVLVHGDMWWEGGTPNYAAACTYPKGTTKNVGFASALWLSGYDAGGQLHVAAQTYRQAGNDYWPGPLDASGTLSYPTSYNWAKIWKVNRTDIQSFQSVGTHTITNTPDAILTWPAKGNANAKGNAGVKLTITENMAPFVDLNSNGVYEPLLGDYPDIKGDQALWWVFSDNGPTHTETNGKPLGVEVHAMSYAYARGTLTDNVVYYEYNLINKSPNSYTSVRAGIRADMDLGYNFDDFVGCDTTLRMAVQYNGVADDGASAGHPANSYGLNPPAVGISWVSLPGDAGSSYVPLGGFTYQNNDASVVGNPTVDTEYNNYMRSKIRDGRHVSNDFQGTGSGYKGYGSGPACNYAYYGDPSDTGEWSECSAPNNPGDRRFVLSSNDFNLAPGSTQQLVMALIVAEGVGGCPSVDFSKIRKIADSAWSVYHNPLPPKPVTVSELTLTGGIKIYPNPAHDQLFIESMAMDNGETHIVIHNTLGQEMKVLTDDRNYVTTVDVSKLPAGLYTVTYRNAQSQTVMKFVKQ